MSGYSLEDFCFEWAPITLAALCVVAGFCHAWACSLSTKWQKQMTFLIICAIIIASLFGMGALNNSIHSKLSGEQGIIDIFLCILIPICAGIGLFAWNFPDSFMRIAENKKARGH